MSIGTIAFAALCLVAADSAEFSERQANFSIELVHHTASYKDGHVVISPFGIWTLMTGVALGASGNTNEQIRRAFLLPRSDKALVDNYKNLTNLVLNSNTQSVTMLTKNYMFLDTGFGINPAFRRTMVYDFGADVQVLNFKDSDTAARVANSHIENLGVKVANVLTSDDFAESRMILTNVISFKGHWGLPFNKSQTTLEPFHNEAGDVVGSVNMMYQSAQLPFSNVKKLRGLALEMPYGHDGRYSMLFLLPIPGVSIKQMYMNLEKVTLKDIFKQLADDIEQYGLEDIFVRVPRFKISTNIVLNRPLNDMGVFDVFEPDLANFAKVTNEPIFVSAIVHKADIEVTESGTVASAVSTATFADRITPPNFNCNRPFVYFVIEKTTTTVLFGGIYSKPSVF